MGQLLSSMKAIIQHWLWNEVPESNPRTDDDSSGKRKLFRYETKFKT